MTDDIGSGSRTVAGDETAVEGKFGIRETERLFRDAGGDTGEFEQHGTWFDRCDVVFDRTFALTHARFRRFFGHWLVGKHPDPQLALTFKMTGNRNTGGFDLLPGHRTTCE